MSVNRKPKSKVKAFNRDAQDIKDKSEDISSDEVIKQLFYGVRRL